jgi:hypothetical protein
LAQKLLIIITFYIISQKQFFNKIAKVKTNYFIAKN